MESHWGDALLSIPLLSALAILAIYVYRTVYLESKIMAFRFELFTLRDELAELAIHGKVSQSSTAYRSIRDAINSAVYDCEEYSFMRLMSSVRSFVNQTNRSKQAYEKFLTEVNRDPDLKRILTSYCDVMLRVLEHNSLFIAIALWTLRHSHLVIRYLQPIEQLRTTRDDLVYV